MTEIRHIDLKQVERGIEEALRVFAGNGRGGSEVSKPIAEEPIEKIGTLSAASIVDASEMTARDIEAAGEAAVEIAHNILEEAKQLGAELRANGKRISEHLEQFAQIARRVSSAMRDTRADVLKAQDDMLQGPQ